MTFAAQETSVRDGQKVYIYTFAARGEFFRYTNAESAVEVGGFTYQPETITHDDPRRTFDEDSESLSIFISGSNPVPNFFVSVVPATGVDVTISSYHRTDVSLEVVTFFEGNVRSGTFDDTGMCELKTASDLVKFSKEIPRDGFHSGCGNDLGDSHCKVNMALFTFDLVVGEIDGNMYTITGLSAAGGVDADYFVAGKIVVGGGVDQRTIYQVTGDEIRVLLPFPSNVIAVGDTVEVSAGCDHVLTGDCLNRFNNAENFGGFSFVPTRNPYQTGLA